MTDQILMEKFGELIFWVRFSALPTFVPLIKNALRDDVDRLVYELSDGQRSTRDIVQIVTANGTKITHTTIANMWEKWAMLNLVMETEKKGRYKRAISLESIGIVVPQYKIAQNKEEGHNE
jgi:hypothetical protein